MTVCGRKPPLALAQANDRKRPNPAIQLRPRERRLSDRKMTVRVPRAVWWLMADKRRSEFRQ